MQAGNSGKKAKLHEADELAALSRAIRAAAKAQEEDERKKVRVELLSLTGITQCDRIACM
jgi:hypothetical protein